MANNEDCAILYIYCTPESASDAYRHDYERVYNNLGCAGDRHWESHRDDPKRIKRKKYLRKNKKAARNLKNPVIFLLNVIDLYKLNKFIRID